ncbi:MAG: carbohydrate ABC transporter permease [Clostridiaceae bacterium]|nr:carbohydrate ABC transporter permease [Clostridiaceae bacterium]
MKKANLYSVMFDVFINIILAMVVVVTLYPFLHVVSVSLSDPYAVMQNKVNFYPVGFNLNAYKSVLSNPYIWISYKNTIVYTVVGTAVNLVLTTAMAYSLSKKYLFGRKFFSIFTTFTLFFNGGIIPNYIIISKLGLIDSMWALILPIAIGTWNLMVMRNYFEGLPSEIEESAAIDGCNPVQVLVKIVLPVSKPIFATMTLFYAVWHWNTYFSPLLYLNDKEKYPLQIFMQQILITGETSFANTVVGIEDTNLLISNTVKYATIMVAILPIIMVYPFLQKYFIKGVLIGSVKG